MTPDVKRMVDAIVEREGGFVDHPADRGGPTKFGITQATLSQWLGRAATRDEVRELERGVAEDIYADRYYREPGVWKLPDRLQPFVFDCAVNHGPRRAAKILQKVCNAAVPGVSRLRPVDVDGRIGPKTASAAETSLSAMGEWMVAALVEERRRFYRAIVEARPDQAAFLEGWLARAEEFWPDGVPRKIMETSSGKV